jgi:hypothetical protein
MAQFRPFAIKTGANVPSGTTQYQNILVGVDQQNYNNLEYDWVAGPDEDLGYVIAFYDADGDTFRGARIGIANCKIGFLRSKFLTESSFLELVNYMRTKLSESTFNNSASAKSWLTSNGYWTSFGEAAWAYGNQEGGAGGSGSWYFYSDAGQLNANAPIQDGNAIFIIRDNQNNTMTETFNPNKSSGTNEIYFNLSDSVGTDYSSQFTTLQTNGGTISITQGANSVTYTSTTPGVFFVESGAGFFIIQAGQATQTVTSASPFVYGDPISIAFN